MGQYRIVGGNRLSGELVIGGAKNAVLPILAAVCLNESETVIYNCPRISDTFATIDILGALGFSAIFIENTLTLNPPSELKYEVPDEMARKMRSSILFMGALLAQAGRAELTCPGGCKLGERGIDLHIEGLEAMGAKISLENEKLFCEAPADGLRGAKIKLAFPSVGATENLLIAAAKARGETVIENAAREPEIEDLAAFLKKLGAKIRGAGTSTIYVGEPEEGCKTCGQAEKIFRKKVEHEVIPDRIVAGTYLLAAAMTAGEIKLCGVRTFDLAPFSSYLYEMGCNLRSEGDVVSLRAPKRLFGVPRIVTRVHPGFPTDMQAQFVAALTLAQSRSEVTETIFENRWSHVAELRKMGANIHLTADKQTFTIEGVPRLHGARVTAHDLRCGAALVLAALAAEGESVVENADYILRGYADIEKDLRALGGEIRLV